jgi:hypothetical protein
VPFDGIGIQAHEPRTMAFALGRVQEILNSYAALGRSCISRSSRRPRTDRRSRAGSGAARGMKRNRPTMRRISIGSVSPIRRWSPSPGGTCATKVRG